MRRNRDLRCLDVRRAGGVGDLYAANGSLSLTLGGLPAGSTATLAITGPDGLHASRTLMTGTGVNLSDVPTGVYTVTAPQVTVVGTVYSPVAPIQSATVNFGTTATINATCKSTARQLAAGR